MVSFKGKSNANQTRIPDDFRAFTNGSIRGFKVYSDTEKIKGRGVESVDENGVRTATKTVMPARKLVPVKKGICQTESSGVLKGCAENSGENMSRRGSSGKVKAGRMALADVSNLRNNSSIIGARNASKTVKIHNGKNLCGPRVVVGQSTTSASVSKKSVTSTTKTIYNQGGTESSCTLKKVDTRDFSCFSGSQKTMDPGHESFGIDGRKTMRKTPMLSRNSLPVIRRGNQIDSKGLKGNVKSFEKGVGNSVKTKVGRKVVPDVSNAKNYLWKNRASDSFIPAKGKSGRRTLLQGVPVGKNIRDPGGVSGKSLRPIGRTTFTTFRDREASKTNKTSGMLKSTTATSSKIKEKVLTEVIPKNVSFVISNESSLEKLPSDGNSFSSMNTTDTISRTSCKRRQSFTSHLMERSEAPRDCREIIKKEELPSIDDKLNHLDVAEYIDDIYQYYWVMEAQYPSLENYMTSQININPKMRGILVNWLIEVHLKFELMQETLFLMVALFDRFLSCVAIARNEMQLVGLTSLLLASKYEDFWHPKVNDLISISADSYTREKMLAMEKLILKKLMFRLNTPTPYVFMLRFLKAAQSDRKLEHLAFYLIELCLIEYEALKFKPSMLCASAIYVARCTLQISPAWSPLLRKHARYEESELRPCAEMILRFHKGSGKGNLKVSYEKYMHLDHSCVARIKALNRLPQ